MRKPVALSAALLLAAFLTACSPKATQPGGPSVAPTALPALSAAAFTSGEAFEALPPGDLLMTIDAGTLINQTLPTALANSPDEKKKFDDGLREMQDKAGIDPKQLKLVALSFTSLTSGKPQFAGVMTGSFDTAKLTESLKKDPKTGEEAQTEQYNGQTLYVRKQGADEFGAAVLDASTLVMGSPASMARAAIDAHAHKRDNATKNADLFNAFKSTKQSGLLRFAMKFPKEQIPAEQAAKDPMTKSFQAINYLTGALDASTGIGIDLTAKTSSPTDAQPLHDNLKQLLDMGKSQVSSNPQMKSLGTILDATTLAVNGSDVQLTLNIPPAQLAELAAEFQKMSGGRMGGMGEGSTGPGTTPPANSNEDE
jgi:hypothetical protein